MQLAFQRVFIRSGPSRKNAALFATHTLGSDLNDFYFSPDAAKIAPNLIAQYRGTATDPPVLSDEILLCVRELGARESLLPRERDSD
jgi:hypothetical protein